MTTTTGRRARATARLDAFGTEVVLVVDRATAMARAEALLRDDLDAVDRACSRFRPDSEIDILHEHPDTWVPVSDVLFQALAVSLEVARRTDGAVDPTVGDAVVRLGYDRDFTAMAPDGPQPAAPRPVPGWHHLELDPEHSTARLAAGVHLDLGSSAKAFAADRAAGRIAALGAGVMISIGGDIAVAGPAPDHGWAIAVAEDSATRAEHAEQVVAITSGGVASSSTVVRSWRRGGRTVHHIVDPSTGDCAPSHWRLVTVAASSCVEANAASTASIIWGETAPERLRSMGLAARLVRHDGMVVTTQHWPATTRSPTGAVA
ncbi:MAG TPA: FAD:protein FMN transferase [Acidimicrobiales bacterium]|nr:FAD:protein FMN transferase [Acidimicrobiales bacterium]